MRKIGFTFLLCITLIGCTHFYKKSNTPIVSLELSNAILVDDNYLLNKYLNKDNELTEKEFNSLLLLALENNSLKSLKALLNRGANVNYVDSKTEKTPIYFVKSLEALKILVEEGANINIENSDKKTLISYFIKYKPLSYTQFLIKRGAYLNNWDILFEAVISGNKILIDMMMEHGANFANVDSYGNYPIYYAYSEEIILELLKEKKYNLKQLNSKKENVLGEVYLRAVANGHIKVVDEILNIGVNPYYMSYGDDAISIAKGENNKDMLEFLKIKGIN